MIPPIASPHLEWCQAFIRSIPSSHDPWWPGNKVVTRKSASTSLVVVSYFIFRLLVVLHPVEALLGQQLPAAPLLALWPERRHPLVHWLTARVMAAVSEEASVSRLQRLLGKFSSIAIPPLSNPSIPCKGPTTQFAIVPYANRNKFSIRIPSHAIAITICKPY